MPCKQLTFLGKAVAITVLILVAPSSAAERHALVIGVSHYPNHRDDDAKGAVNDAWAMERFLTRECGFPEENVRVLTDEKATLEAIRAAFRDLAEEVEIGDTVLVHFSGHGSREPDENGDEDDGWDETLCPYDHTPLGNNSLVDDELGIMLDRLKASWVVVTLDCCHSGTATKSLSAPRSFRPPPPTTAKPYPTAKSSRDAGQSSRNPRETVSAPSGQVRIVLSACSDDQKANEVLIQDLAVPLRSGPLTYFLLEGLRGRADSNRDRKVSYQEAYDHLKRRTDEILNRDVTQRVLRQTPQMQVSEQGIRDQPFLGLLSIQPPYARIVNREADRVDLDTGAVHGLAPGTILSLHRFRDGRVVMPNALGRIEIESLDTTSSQARVLSGSPADPAVAAVPVKFRPQRVQPAVAVTVEYDPARNGADWAKQLKSVISGRLQKLAGVQIAQREACDMLLTVTVKAGNRGGLSVSAHLLESNGLEHRSPSWDLDGVTPRQLVSSTRKNSVLTSIVTWAKVPIAALGNRLQLAAVSNPLAGFGVQGYLGYPDRPPQQDTNSLPQYQTHDRLKFVMRVTADCFYYVFKVDPKGNAEVWCPTAKRPKHYARAQVKFLHPGPGDAYIVRGEPGVHMVKLLAVRKKLPPEAIIQGLPSIEYLWTLPSEDWAETSTSFVHSD